MNNPSIYTEHIRQHYHNHNHNPHLPHAALHCTALELRSSTLRFAALRCVKTKHQTTYLLTYIRTYTYTYTYPPTYLAPGYSKAQVVKYKHALNVTLTLTLMLHAEC